MPEINLRIDLGEFFSLKSLRNLIIYIFASLTIQYITIYSKLYKDWKNIFHLDNAEKSSSTILYYKYSEVQQSFISQSKISRSKAISRDFSPQRYPSW